MYALLGALSCLRRANVELLAQLRYEITQERPIFLRQMGYGFIGILFPIFED